VSEPTVSIVVPVYNNSQTLRALCERITDVAAAAWPGEAVEIVLVDDASPDGAWDTISELAGDYPGVHGVRLGRNVGQHEAVLTGFSIARGRFLVSIDGDLQDPPEALPAMRAAFTDRSDLVFAGRRGRYQAWSAMLTSALYRRIVLSTIRLPRDSGMFFIITRQGCERLLDALIDRPSVIGLIAARLRTNSIPVERSLREQGVSSYTFRSRLRSAYRVWKTWARAKAGGGGRTRDDLLAGIVGWTPSTWNKA
jgi:glycosyltransferase involved in cell wall biosynthesis